MTTVKDAPQSAPHEVAGSAAGTTDAGPDPRSSPVDVPAVVTANPRGGRHTNLHTGRLAVSDLTHYQHAERLAAVAESTVYEETVLAQGLTALAQVHAILALTDALSGVDEAFDEAAARYSKDGEK